ncbi:MAG: hypothetical protein K9I68_10965 [Bacteroidales bacterium]|nr:hypothetical protein [Bacteroidales bacterium]
MKYLKKPWIIILALGILFIISQTGNKMANAQNNNDVMALFSNAATFEGKTFSYDQLEGLPAPVQRYFKHVLPQGQPYVESVRLKHDGRFKSGVDKDWTDIKGEQYFTSATPGFLWVGKTSLFTARDMYICDQGRLVVKLFSLVKVVDEKGSHVDQGELLRWLGESVWFPTNLLPRKNLEWSPINDTSARVTFSHNGISVFLDVFFNENDEIVRLETERYMEKNRLEKWSGELSDYREVNGMKIPMHIQASWDLKEKTHTYADFQIQNIEFDVPERF